MTTSNFKFISLISILFIGLFGGCNNPIPRNLCGDNDGDGTADCDDEGDDDVTPLADDDATADDDDATADDDSTPTPLNDEIGTLGCTAPFSQAKSWLESRTADDPIPVGFMCDDADCDGDGDGDLDIAAATVVWLQFPNALDVIYGDTTLSTLISFTWTCLSVQDLTDDDTDDDGDGFTENQGDLDDGSIHNCPDVEMCPEICGDLFRNFWTSNTSNPFSGVDESCDADADGDGWTPLEGDCGDADADVNPFAFEWDDGFDSDCDGVGDNLAHYDLDGDCYCQSEDCRASSNSSCDLVDGGSHGGDCGEADPNQHPNAPEGSPSDGYDHDCDGLDD